MTDIDTRAELSGSQDTSQTVELSLQTEENDQKTFKLSKRRWAICFAVCIFSFMGGISDESSTILHTILELLEMPLTKYVYIGQLFSYLPLVTTIPTAWFVDTYGIRPALYAATAFMLIRNLFRSLMFNTNLPMWEEYKFAYWIISSLAGWQAGSIFWCVPLKISETWFSEAERSLAWTVMVMTGGLGTSVAALVYPRIIHDGRDVKPLFYINIAGAMISTLAVLICVTRSKPKYPPNERTSRSAEALEQINYLRSIINLFKQRDFMIHLFHAAIYDGVYWALYGIIQDILTSSGHSEVFVGDLISMNSIYSMIVIVGMASFVYSITDITIACKLASLLKCISFIAYMFSMLYTVPEWVIISTSILYCTCKCWAIPNYTNMTAQLASGVISEATVAGFSSLITIMSVSINSMIFVTIINTSPDGKADYTHSIKFASILILINSTVYFLFFNGPGAKNKETESES